MNFSQEFCDTLSLIARKMCKIAVPNLARRNESSLKVAVIYNTEPFHMIIHYTFIYASIMLTCSINEIHNINEMFSMDVFQRPLYQLLDIRQYDAKFMVLIKNTPKVAKPIVDFLRQIPFANSVGRQVGVIEAYNPGSEFMFNIRSLGLSKTLERFVNDELKNNSDLIIVSTARITLKFISGTTNYVSTYR